MGLRNKVDRALGRALVAIMGAMVLNVLWQVFSRYITGDPSPFTDELARYLMVWVGILGAAYVSGRNMHVAIDVLPMRAGKRAQGLLFRTVNALIILFALFALVGGAPAWCGSAIPWGSTPPPWGCPWPWSTPCCP